MMRTRWIAIPVVALAALYVAGRSTLPTRAELLTSDKALDCTSSDPCSSTVKIEYCLSCLTIMTICKATWDFDRIVVSRYQSPRLVWKLDAPSFAYEFDANGIELNPADQNDPSYDLDDAKPDSREFSWLDRNKRKRDDDQNSDVRKRPIRFDFNISHVLPFNQRRRCLAYDPIIRNQGY